MKRRSANRGPALGCCPHVDLDPDTSVSVPGEIQAAVDDIAAGYPDTARQILQSLLHTLNQSGEAPDA